MDAGRLLEKPSELSRHDSLRLAGLQEIYGVPAREQSLSDYWRILQKRKWTVIVSVVVVFITAGLITIRQTPIYDAVTSIVISRRSSNPLNLKDADASADDEQQDINTEIKILQSDTMAESVIRRLNLDGRPEFAGNEQVQSSGGIPVTESPAQERARQEQLVRKFQGSLKVQQVPDTALVEIKYSNPDPSLAAEIANAITTTFIEQNVKARYDSTTQATDWLSKQLAGLQINLESVGSQACSISKGSRYRRHRRQAKPDD